MSSVIRRNYHDVIITNVCFKEIKNLNDSLFGILKSYYT